MADIDIDLEKIDWQKSNGLIPAIIQHAVTHKVLMLAYMDEPALQQTIETKKVTFYSRSKQRLWTKGETSGNFLLLKSITQDCDADTLLIKVEPTGPTCHLGTESCFKNNEVSETSFFDEMMAIIKDRQISPTENSYVSQLFQSGIKRIAQKVGEEGVEVALAAAVNDRTELAEEAADLLFHLSVLLSAMDMDLNTVIKVLKCRRHQLS